MSESTRPHDPNELSKIYGKLNSQDVEQFYAGYQLWQIQQQALSLEAQIEDLRREIAANAELMQMVHLPAIALATVARLQASGVNDIALLDRMVERGEEWLDRTMQRLDYCEQLDFMIDDYTQWCQNALEGAYDWIDSMREDGTSSPSQASTSEAPGEATEALLLQKLTSEEDERSPLSETAQQQAEPSESQELASASPELPINGEQSTTTSVGATFMAPRDEAGETVSDFDTTPKEEAPPSEEQVTTIEQAQDTIETSPDLEETAPELQDEQKEQLVQVSQLPQSVEVDAASEPLEASPTSDISTESERVIEEETSSNKDAMIHPAPLHAPPTELNSSLDSQPSTDEASENEQPTSQVDGVVDEDTLASTSPVSENEQPTSQVDREFASEQEELPSTQPASETEQPVSGTETLENTEQSSMRESMPHRRHNFLLRLAAKILGS